MAGMFWNYFVSNHRPEIANYGVFLSEEGVLPIYIEPTHTSQAVMGLWKQLKESGNLDQVIEKG